VDEDSQEEKEMFVNTIEYFAPSVNDREL